jgi:hypothetical protein
VADYDSGLQVIDISDPTNPSIVGSCDTPDSAWGIFVSGTCAYVTGGVSGLQVIDISSPTNPSIMGSYDTPGFAGGIFVSGTYAYVAGGVSGLQVIDISSPTNPSIMGSFYRGSAKDVYIQGTYAYVAGGVSGLQVIDKFKPLADITYLNSATITARVPAGFRLGTYNLHVTNPDGGYTMLNNIFTVYWESIPDICLSTGLNIFGYPVDVASWYTSYDLIRALGTEGEISKIQRYDPNTKTYWTTTYDPNGVACGYDFNIVSGEGYLVYTKATKSVSFDGLIINPSIRLVEGLNIVSIPYIPSGYTSYELLLYLGSPEEIASIQRFNREKGIFETTSYYYGRPSGIKFEIVNGFAYLILMKVSKYKDAPVLHENYIRTENRYFLPINQ